MRCIPLDAANHLYACSECRTLSSITVDHVALRVFLQAVGHLEHDLGDSLSDDIWQHFFRRIRRYQFDVTTAPIPVCWQGQELTSLLQSHITLCRISYPRFIPAIERLQEQMQGLAHSVANPLLEALLTLADTHDLQNGAMLLKAQRLAPTVETILAGSPALSHLVVVNEHELRLAECYGTLLIIGPRRWFPDFVFTAPRAATLFSVRYRWPRDSWKLQPAFLGSLNDDRRRTASEATDESDQLGSEDGLDGGSFDSSEAMWSLGLDAVTSDLGRHGGDDQDTEEVEAHALVLAGGTAVLLETADDATTLILDFDEDDDEEDSENEQTSHITRVTTGKIRPGMFLLLRTGGGGDYIVPIADRMLGQHAQRLRGMQEEWKHALRTLVQSRGLLAISVDLLDLGSKRANEINVRNWMSARNIRPRDFSDFLAIMRLVGMEDRANEYWHAAETIDAAHRRAGFYLRNLLLKQVRGADLRTLQRKGRLDFHLAELEGGTLSAFRVEHILPDSLLVPVSRLGRPFPIEER